MDNTLTLTAEQTFASNECDTQQIMKTLHLQPAPSCYCAEYY